MIVNGAVLSAEPAKQQGVVGRAGMHQVTAIALGRELHEVMQLPPIIRKASKSLGQDLEGDWFTVLVQLGEPFFECVGHTQVLIAKPSVIPTPCSRRKRKRTIQRL